MCATKNVSRSPPVSRSFDTTSYSLTDHLVKRTVQSLSRLIGVKNVTRPLWNRWRASLIGDEAIMNFLRGIRSIDDWEQCALELVVEEEDKYRASAPTLTDSERILLLHRLSYLCLMGQWGVIPLSPGKKELYIKSRDYYIEAETLANGALYQRVAIPWENKFCYGNLHLPKNGKGQFPLVIIVHGMDDSKEEHLATELALQEHGLAVFCFDAPGQAESLLLEGLTWPRNFHDSISSAIDTLTEGYNCDPQRIGVVGISWAGMWVYKAAMADNRIKAVYDLGGPIHADDFHRIPYFLKTRFCQALGIEKPTTVPELGAFFTIKDETQLAKVRCPVRIIHGGKDPFVSLGDKQWLKSKLQALHPEKEVSMLVFPEGDHCCTGNGAEMRQDAIGFFSRVL